MEVSGFCSVDGFGGFYLGVYRVQSVIRASAACLWLWGKGFRCAVVCQVFWCIIEVRSSVKNGLTSYSHFPAFLFIKV